MVRTKREAYFESHKINSWIWKESERNIKECVERVRYGVCVKDSSDTEHRVGLLKAVLGKRRRERRERHIHRGRRRTKGHPGRPKGKVEVKACLLAGRDGTDEMALR